MSRFALLALLFLGSACLANDTQFRIFERYQEILARSPKRGTAFDRVYEHYVDAGRSHDFLQNCLAAVQNNPANPNAQLLLGLVAERRNQTELALASFQTAAELDPSNFLPMLYFGEVLLNQRRIHEAVTALEHADARLQNHAGSRIDRRTVLQTLALAYARLGNSEKSLAAWNQLAALFPNDPDVLVQIAESLEFDGRLDEALQQYRHLIPLTDEPFDRIQLSLAVADILFRRGEDTAALDDLNALLGMLDSESYLAHTVHSRIERIFQRNRDLDRQVAFYQNRLSRQPGDTASLRRLVQTLQRADRSPEAEKLLSDAIQVSPSNVSLRLLLIDLLTERQDIVEAIEQFRMIDQIVPNQPDYLIRWGSLVLQHPALEEYQRRFEAAEIWHRIASRSPNDPVALVQVADLFLRSRFHAEAERYYQDALSLRPHDFSYREHLAAFYHQSRQRERVLETLLADSPRDAAHAGQLLLAWGYIPEAADVLRNAVRNEHFHDNLQGWTLQYRYIEALLRLDTPESLLEVAERFRDSANRIESDEQFALFLQQYIQLVRSLHKTAEMIEIAQKSQPQSEDCDVRSAWHLAALHHAAGDFASAIGTLTSARAEDGSARTGGVSPPVLASFAADGSTRAGGVSPPVLASFAGDGSARAGGVSPPVLTSFAAELHEQTGNAAAAIELYRQLVREDPARAGNYWQQIITLQIQHGELQQALESTQNLIGLGTGNAVAANAQRLRFVADLFLSVHRQEEAVRLLRQALHLEPGNTDILRMLAQTLADAEQHEEAVELLWRLYDRLDNAAGKLSVVAILTNAYSNLARDADLVEHFRHLSKNHAHRREALQALARVFTLQGDDEEALHTLEMLLDMPADEESSQGVLRELVALSERLADYAAAARYQEMLAQRANDPREQNHLFYLYDKLGDTAGTRRLFFDQLLRQGNLEGRLELIDTMLRREQYDLAVQALDFLEIHEPEHWAIQFRRILTDARQGKPVEPLVKDFWANTMNEPTAAIVPAGRSESFIFSDVAPPEFNASLAVQDQFLPVLFQVRGLQSAGDVSMVKTLHDAKFLALGFLIREAVNRDIAAQSEAPTALRDTLAELRALFPSDGETAINRLRLEIWLLDLLRFNRQYRIIPPEILQPQIDERAGQNTIWQIVRHIAQSGAPDWQRALLYIRMAEYPEELLAEYAIQVLDQVLDELGLAPADFLPVRAPQTAPPAVSLTRFRSELQGDRPIDRSAIYALLPNYNAADEPSEIDELHRRVLAFRRSAIRARERRDTRPAPMPIRVVIEGEPPAEVPVRNPDAELWELVHASTGDENAPANLALALLYTRLQQYGETVAVLDAMDLTASSDILAREWIIARLAVKYANENPALQQRGRLAVDRLLNFRLPERDMLNLIPMLLHYGREEEIQRIWDRLSATVSDRRLMAELFNRLQSEGEPQRENTAKIAHRILANPAFLQNSRRLSADLYLLESAIRVLREQERLELVIPMLESRFRGLRDATDSRILLARLYLMLDRWDEARTLALELAQAPSAEPERRQTIVSLLVHFGLHRELESMHRLLLERR
ncbi:MAG: tetratricopeptide repeat protein [Planctomycetaceae bacterium]|nr:tetratricopeptide repeat protein [Planctomycetaceae bacterium]